MKEQLTREQIWSMNPGFELDALIAQHVMSWEQSEAWRGSNWVRSEDKTFMCNVIAWRPSLDLRDAWEVVEIMKSRNITVHIIASKNNWYSADVWLNGSKLLSTDASTAPEAICRVALLTTVEEVKA